MKRSLSHTPQTTRHIDLTVPKGWNQCSREQLETIMGLYLRRLAMQDRYHPFDPLQWKTECFLALAGLQVIDTVGTVPAVGSDAESERTTEGLSPSVSITPQETTYLVRLRDRRHWWRRIFGWAHTGGSPSVNASLSQQGQSPSEPFPLRDWELLSFVDSQMKWLDSFNGLMVCRWKDMGRSWQWTWLWGVLPLPCRRRIVTSDALLQDFSWQRYRLCDTHLSTLIRSWNDQTDGFRLPDSQQFRAARNQLLSQLFFLDEPVIDRGGRPTQDLTRLSRSLHRLSPAALQVLMVHWQSVQHYLQGQFPRCFKEQRPTKNRRAAKVNPLKLYTRSTATLQKYLQKTEDEINAQPYQVILQHLEDMAREAEEMEKINRRNKSKGRH